jgi:dihydroorotate dehydrogenase
MLLEELTQEELDHLVACTKQRTLFAACVGGIMQLDITGKEGLAMKATILQVVAMGMEMGARVGDDIERRILISMKEHCEEQIEIAELLDSINP